ncbi:MAG: transcriptional regulator [Ktedonobacteraceae bacterium]
MICRGGLKEIIHQMVRLRIMAALASFPPEVQVTFTYLKNALDLTDGNLGSHLHKLECAGCLMINRTFVGNKPQTNVGITEAGRQAFEEYSAETRGILESNKHIDRDATTDAAK